MARSQQHGPGDGVSQSLIMIPSMFVAFHAPYAHYPVPRGCAASIGLVITSTPGNIVQTTLTISYLEVISSCTHRCSRTQKQDDGVIECLKPNLEEGLWGGGPICVSAECRLVGLNLIARQTLLEVGAQVLC